MLIIEDSRDFRSVAEVMTTAGFQMNHATARNVFLSSMRTFLKLLASELGHPIPKAQLEEMLTDQEVYTTVCDVLLKIDTTSALIGPDTEAKLTR